MLTLNRKKKLTILVIFLLLAGTVSAYYIRGYYQEKEQATLNKARTDMIKAQAAANNIKLLSDKEIKDITAVNTGVPLDQLTFKEVSLITFDDLPHEPPPNDRYGDTPHNDTLPKNLREDVANNSVASSATEKATAGTKPADLPPDAKEAVNQHKGQGDYDGDKGPHRDGPPNKEMQNATDNEGKPQIPNYSRTHPNELRKHPLYRIVANSNGITYDLLIDAVNGHILRSTVR